MKHGRRDVYGVVQHYRREDAGMHIMARQLSDLLSYRMNFHTVEQFLELCPPLTVGRAA